MNVKRAFKIFAAVLLLAIGILAIGSYQARQERNRIAGEAFEPARKHGARIGSLGGWPMGREWAIYFPAENSLTNENAAKLASIAQVRGDYIWLSLVNTELSDEGLVHLGALTNVNSLALNQDRISEAGRDRLQAALPDTRVYLSPPLPETASGESAPTVRTGCN